jgi:Protein of unknown function (DUF2631)
VATVPSSQLEKPTTNVDPEDEPSAEWGWHGKLPKGAMIAGWVVAIILFCMLIGNQQGHVEDIYLIIFGALMVLLQVGAIVRRRNSWRR